MQETWKRNMSVFEQLRYILSSLLQNNTKGKNCFKTDKNRLSLRIKLTDKSKNIQVEMSTA